MLGNRGKTRVFWLIYQLHSSSANCARELFKPLKISAIFESAKKTNFWFWDSGLSKVDFWPILAAGT